MIILSLGVTPSWKPFSKCWEWKKDFRQPWKEQLESVCWMVRWRDYAIPLVSDLAKNIKHSSPISVCVKTKTQHIWFLFVCTQGVSVCLWKLFFFFFAQSHSDSEKCFITMGGWGVAVRFIYVTQYMVKMNMEFKSLNEAVLIHGLRNEGSKK